MPGFTQLQRTNGPKSRSPKYIQIDMIFIKEWILGIPICQDKEVLQTMSLHYRIGVTVIPLVQASIRTVG